MKRRMIIAFEKNSKQASHKFFYIKSSTTIYKQKLCTRKKKSRKHILFLYEREVFICGKCNIGLLYRRQNGRK